MLRGSPHRFPIAGKQIFIRLLPSAYFRHNLPAFLGERNEALSVLRLAGVETNRIVQQIHLRAAHLKQFCFAEAVGIGERQESASHS
jgi:hypothetical protein